MLPESKVISFLEEKYGFSLRILEGQKIIHDLAIIHDVKSEGFNFFRELVLSGLHLISYLKINEGFGLFIDSDNPYFRFKIEANENGTLRTLLIPEDFTTFPEKITGIARLSKVFPNNPRPYTSIIEIKNQRVGEITNNILKDSYQVHGKIVLSEKSDQSLYLTKLPRKNINKEIEDLSLDEFWEEHGQDIMNILDEGLVDSSRIKNKLGTLGFTYLHSKELNFRCPCSRKQMVLGVSSLIKNHTIDEIFEDKSEIETRCDYCKTYYIITRQEIESSIKN